MVPALMRAKELSMEDEKLEERDPEQDLMPEAMDSDEHQDTESAAEKIAAALDFGVSRQADTPRQTGQTGM
jgi:hypothetical protein